MSRHGHNMSDALVGVDGALEYHIVVQRGDDEIVSASLIQQRAEDVLNDDAGAEQAEVVADLAASDAQSSENDFALVTVGVDVSDGMVGATAASLVALERIMHDEVDGDESDAKVADDDVAAEDIVLLRRRLSHMSRRLSVVGTGGQSAGGALTVLASAFATGIIEEGNESQDDDDAAAEPVAAAPPLPPLPTLFTPTAANQLRVPFPSPNAAVEHSLPPVDTVPRVQRARSTSSASGSQFSMLRVALDSVGGGGSAPATGSGGDTPVRTPGTRQMSVPSFETDTATSALDGERPLLSASSLALRDRLSKFNAQIQALPSTAAAPLSRAFRINWLWHLLQHHGVCTVDWVAQVNRSVHLIDIRTEEEVCGAAGHISGSAWFPLDTLHTLPTLLPNAQCPVVVIAQHEDEARLACAELERLGLTYVAPMQGGIMAWRHYGFSCARDTALLAQRGHLRPRTTLEQMDAHALPAPQLLQIQIPTSPVGVPPPPPPTTTTTGHRRRASIANLVFPHADASHSTSTSLPPPSAAAAAAATAAASSIATSDAVTLGDIKRHVGDANSLRWLKLSAFTLHESLSCVDGRNDDAVCGTPGGDVGEICTALSVAEELCGTQLTNEQVAVLMRRRVDELGRIYMHTDSHALDTLSAHMLTDPRLAAAMQAASTSPFDFRLFMRSPPVAIREVLLEHMLLPAHLGCGHLRLMIQNPEKYGVRADLTRSVMRAFFIARWEGVTECEYISLGGKHTESGVVCIRVDEGEGDNDDEGAGDGTKTATAPLFEDLAPFTRIPLVSPMVEGKQTFISHPQVASHLRRQLARFFSRQRDILPLTADARRQFFARIEQKANTQLGLTLGQLAKGLPVYDLQFGADRITISCGDQKSVFLK